MRVKLVPTGMYAPYVPVAPLTLPPFAFETVADVMLIDPAVLICVPIPAETVFVFELMAVPPVRPKLPLFDVELPMLEATEMTPELDELKLPPDIVIDEVICSHPNEVATAILLALASDRPPELMVVPVAPISR